MTGAEDPRSGDVQVILPSHAHGDQMGNRMGDHIGARKMKAQDAGTCAAPETVSAAPNSTTAEIAAAKDSTVVMMIPMLSFIGKKIENVKEKPTGAREMLGSALVVPLPMACIAGASISAGRASPPGAARAVEITLVRLPADQRLG